MSRADLEREIRDRGIDWRASLTALAQAVLALPKPPAALRGSIERVNAARLDLDTARERLAARDSSSAQSAYEYGKARGK